MSDFTKKEHEEHLEQARKDVGRETEIRREQERIAQETEHRQKEEQARQRKEEGKEELSKYREEAERRVAEREEEEKQRRQKEQEEREQERQEQEQRRKAQEEKERHEHKEKEKPSGAKEEEEAETKEKGKHPITSFRNVAIALDDSAGSAAALNWALENILKPQTDVLQVLSVGPHDSYIAELSSMTKSDKGHEEVSLEPSPGESKEIIEMRAVLKKAQDTIDEYCAKNDEKISYMLFPVKGANPKDNIVHFCKMHHSDLIILGSSGASGLRRMVLGSTSEYVVRNAPCPVLVVREVEGKIIH